MSSISRKQIQAAVRAAYARKVAVVGAWDACTLTARRLLAKPSTLLGGAAFGFSVGWLSRPRPCPACAVPGEARPAPGAQGQPGSAPSALSGLRRRTLGLLSASLKALAILRALQGLLSPK